jgi:hypothetical protein
MSLSMHRVIANKSTNKNVQFNTRLGQLTNSYINNGNLVASGTISAGAYNTGQLINMQVVPITRAIQPSAVTSGSVFTNAISYIPKSSYSNIYVEYIAGVGYTSATTNALVVSQSGNNNTISFSSLSNVNIVGLYANTSSSTININITLTGGSPSFPQPPATAPYPTYIKITEYSQ